ncbi:MAG TPA: hypothetical protein VG347_21695 [Verrucomicrobiae bacterium]|nr:hypothetical protein [Verrucomicrobiae bacterium]
MKIENIIPELHRHRENLMRTCGLDVKKLVAHYQRLEAGRNDAGHKLVSFAGAPVEKRGGRRGVETA